MRYAQRQDFENKHIKNVDFSFDREKNKFFVDYWCLKTYSNKYRIISGNLSKNAFLKKHRLIRAYRAFVKEVHSLDAAILLIAFRNKIREKHKDFKI